MHIYINFILPHEFDVKYYFICFILIIKVKYNYKMKWKCVFSKISSQRNPLRKLITPPTKLPVGLPNRAVGHAGRLCACRGRLPSEQSWLHHHATSQAHSLHDAKIIKLATSLANGPFGRSLDWVTKITICEAIVSWRGEGAQRCAGGKDRGQGLMGILPPILGCTISSGHRLGASILGWNQPLVLTGGLVRGLASLACPSPL